MKKSLFLLFVAFFTTMSFSLLSCGDKDDEPSDSNTNTIVGTWECIEGLPLIFGEGSAQYIQFNSNGNYYEVNIIPPLFTGDKPEIEKLTGTWKQSGNDITVTTNAPYGAKIKKSTKTMLKIEMMSMEITYQKVDDSIMNQYFN